MMWTDEQVAAAVNRAVDHVLDATDAPETGLRHALYLVANATTHYLHNPRARLSSVAKANYSVPLDTILGWIDS